MPVAALSSTPAPKPWRAARPAILAAALAALVAVVFAGVKDCGFVFDDSLVISDPHILRGLTTAGLRRALTSNWWGNWFPLLLISQMLEVEFFGMHPGSQHVINAVLHGVNTLLLFRVLSLMTGVVWRSAAVAALFAVHPFHVEAVVFGRADLLSTLFGLLAVTAYVRYAQRPGAVRYLAVALWLAASLASKAMLVTLPFLLLLLDAWPLNRAPGWRLAWEKLPLLGLAAAASVAVFYARQSAGAMSMAHRYPFPLRVANAAASYGAYLRKTLWPSEFAVMYPHPEDALAVSHYLPGVVAILLATGLALAFRRRCPSLATGWFWFFGTLIPVIGLVQVGDQAMADRYTYVPLIGLFVAAAWAVPPLRFGWHKAAVGAAAATAVAVLAVVAASQIPHWKNNRSLYQHALEVAPGSWMMHADLAAELIAAGELNEALAHLRATVRLRPELPEAHHNLGLVLASLGRHEEAVAAFRETLRLLPHHPRADANLGLSLKALERLAEAVPHLERGVSRNPASADALVELGTALLGLGRLNEGAARFSQAVRLAPERAGALSFALGNAYARAGLYELSVAAFREAVRAQPDARTYNNLGSSYANGGRYREAEEAYAEALRIEPGNQDARRNLALVRRLAAGRR